MAEALDMSIRKVEEVWHSGEKWMGPLRGDWEECSRHGV